MILPFVLFWLLAFFGRDELGARGLLALALVWASLLVGTALSGLSPYAFVAAQACIDIVLVLVIFGGDLRIR